MSSIQYEEITHLMPRHPSITQNTNRRNRRSPGFVFVSAKIDENMNDEGRFPTKLAQINQDQLPLKRTLQLKGQDDGAPQVTARKLPVAKKKNGKKQDGNASPSTSLLKNFSQSLNKKPVGGRGGGDKNRLKLNYSGQNNFKQGQGNQCRSLGFYQVGPGLILHQSIINQSSINHQFIINQS